MDRQPQQGSFVDAHEFSANDLPTVMRKVFETVPVQKKS
jgi:hypothetical protein